MNNVCCRDISSIIANLFPEEAGNDTQFEFNMETLQRYWDKVSGIDYTSIYEKISAFSESWQSTVLEAGSSVFSFLGSIFTGLLGFVDNALTIFIFLGALMYLVDTDHDVVDVLFKLVPVTNQVQQELANGIKNNITQLFCISLLLCIIRGFVTWLYFSIMGIVRFSLPNLDLKISTKFVFYKEFAYSAGFLTAPTAIFPLLSPWLLFVPAIAASYMRSDPYWWYYAIGIIINEVKYLR